jgi:hypothetical protein
MKFIAIVSFDI